MGGTECCKEKSRARISGPRFLCRARISTSQRLRLGFLNGGFSGSDLKEIVKSRARILNEGLGVSASLGFYHSIPLTYSTKLN